MNGLAIPRTLLRRPSRAYRRDTPGPPPACRASGPGKAERAGAAGRLPRMRPVLGAAAIALLTACGASSTGTLGQVAPSDAPHDNRLAPPPTTATSQSPAA